MINMKYVFFILKKNGILKQGRGQLLDYQTYGDSSIKVWRTLQTGRVRQETGRRQRGTKYKESLEKNFRMFLKTSKIVFIYLDTDRVINGLTLSSYLSTLIEILYTINTGIGGNYERRIKSQQFSLNLKKYTWIISHTY